MLLISRCQKTTQAKVRTWYDLWVQTPQDQGCTYRSVLSISPSKAILAPSQPTLPILSPTPSFLGGSGKRYLVKQTENSLFQALVKASPFELSHRSPIASSHKLIHVHAEGSKPFLWSAGQPALHPLWLSLEGQYSRWSQHTSSWLYPLLHLKKKKIRGKKKLRLKESLREIY